MDELIAENADVITRIMADGVDLSVAYDVEFIAVFPTEAAANQVAMMYKADSKMGKQLINIKTTPREEQAVALLLVKSMLVTAESISAFESQLIERAKGHGGYTEGWGMLAE
jgi:hypothetical protein